MNSPTIENILIEHGFLINSVKRIGFGQQIRLACGIVISVYDKGTVLVQGRLNTAAKPTLLETLNQLLPPDTRWGC